MRKEEGTRVRGPKPHAGVLGRRTTVRRMTDPEPREPGPTADIARVATASLFRLVDGALHRDDDVPEMLAPTGRQCEDAGG